jgi:hypothetical protein
VGGKETAWGARRRRGGQGDGVGGKETAWGARRRRGGQARANNWRTLAAYAPPTSHRRTTEGDVRDRRRPLKAGRPARHRLWLARGPSFVARAGVLRRSYLVEPASARRRRPGLVTTAWHSHSAKHEDAPPARHVKDGVEEDRTNSEPVDPSLLRVTVDSPTARTPVESPNRMEVKGAPHTCAPGKTLHEGVGDGRCTGEDSPHECGAARSCRRPETTR